MNKILKKLTSRKFWAMILGVGLGVGAAFGLDGDKISATAGLVSGIITLITYIITEGKIDAAAIEAAKKEGSNANIIRT